MTLEMQGSSRSIQPQNSLPPHLKRKTSMTQKKQERPNPAPEHVMSTAEKVTERRPSLTQQYPPPPPAEIEKYARRPLPALPMPSPETPQEPLVAQWRVSRRNNTEQNSDSKLTSLPIPSTNKPLLVTVGDRSFAARAANDTRFAKAMWGIDVRQTGRRDSLTGKVEVEISGCRE